MSLVEQQFNDFKKQLHELMKELLTYKQKMTESTSNDDSDTSKGNNESTQSDTNEVEKGITIYLLLYIIIIIV